MEILGVANAPVEVGRNETRLLADMYHMRVKKCLNIFKTI